MKAILLDGSEANDNTGERVRAALTAQLQSQGWEVEHVVLREKEIGACGGEFFCWVKHPGMCMWDDDNRVIAAAIVASDLMVYLTPVTFGGYSSALKRMVDHQIQNISPFFARIGGETHHHKRYKRNPDTLVVGWIDAPDMWSETVFRHLVQRNAANWRSKTAISDVVLASQSDEALEALALGWLSDLSGRRSSQRVELPTSGSPATGTGPGSGNVPIEVRRALLLVGSPKASKSTSNSLGAYMYEQLAARSIQIETIHLHTVLHSPDKTQALLDAVDAADLVTLAFPLYVDSLSAPTIEALECVATHRQRRDSSRRQSFAAIANCGFPEAHQCATALAICEIFSHQAGFEWAGALALGGGGIVNGVPLAEGGGKTMLMRQSLDLAAEALAQGQRIPQAARDSLSKPLIPHWLYRLMGDLGWNQTAKGFGAKKLLRRQPYVAPTK